MLRHFALSSCAISDKSNQPNLTKLPETSIWALFCISYANELCRTWAIPTPNRLDCLGISKYSIWRHPDVSNPWKWPKTKLRHKLHSWWCPFWSFPLLEHLKNVFCRHLHHHYLLDIKGVSLNKYFEAKKIVTSR